MLSFEQLDQLRAWCQDTGHQPTAAQVEKLRWSLIDGLKKHPLVQRYLRQYDWGLFRNTRPWQAIGEQLSAALVLASVGLAGFEGVRIEPSYLEMSGANPANLGVGWALRMLASQVFLWSNVANELASAAPLPSHVISRAVLPYPMMFVSREAACRLSMDANPFHGVSGDRETDWMVITDGGEGIEVVYNASGPDAAGYDSVMCCSGIPYGRRYPDDFSEVERPGAASLLQMLAFMSSPFTETVRQRLDRPQRRELARAGLKPEQVEQEVHTVMLRRAAQELVAAYAALSAAERKHHWWVSGHYRAQWYPSETAHKVIWIAPYVKGDLSKPLLSKVYAVVR